MDSHPHLDTCASIFAEGNDLISMRFAHAACGVLPLTDIELGHAVSLFSMVM